MATTVETLHALVQQADERLLQRIVKKDPPFAFREEEAITQEWHAILVQIEDILSELPKDESYSATAGVKHTLEHIKLGNIKSMQHYISACCDVERLLGKIVREHPECENACRNTFDKTSHFIASHSRQLVLDACDGRLLRDAMPQDMSASTRILNQQNSIPSYQQMQYVLTNAQKYFCTMLESALALRNNPESENYSALRRVSTAIPRLSIADHLRLSGDNLEYAVNSMLRDMDERSKKLQSNERVPKTNATDAAYEALQESLKALSGRSR